LESNNGPELEVRPAREIGLQWVAISFASTNCALASIRPTTSPGPAKFEATSGVTESGDEFTANIQTDILLPNGTLLPFHPAGTSHGIRVPIGNC